MNKVQQQEYIVTIGHTYFLQEVWSQGHILCWLRRVQSPFTFTGNEGGEVLGEEREADTVLCCEKVDLLEKYTCVAVVDYKA